MSQNCSVCEYLYKEMEGYYCSEKGRYISAKDAERYTCEFFRLSRKEAMKQKDTEVE